MSRGCLIVVVAGLVLILVPAACGIGSYNGLIAQEEAVTAAWSQIDNMYKRRADLVPQLVQVVKGAADFESSTVQAVIEARASVGRVQLPEGVPTDSSQLDDYMAAQSGLGSALGRLFAVSERYPELRATQGFLDLQAQIEGSENRIATARTDLIQAVRSYNTKRRGFPTKLIADYFGFKEAAILEVEQSAREVPQIDFGNDG